MAQGGGADAGSDGGVSAVEITVASNWNRPVPCVSSLTGTRPSEPLITEPLTLLTPVASG